MSSRASTALPTPAPSGTSAGGPVAEVAGLAVTFGGGGRGGAPVRALREVDLDIRPAEILGLVGESGSGKTVLGLSLLGLLPAHAEVEGAVWVDGVEMGAADGPTRRRVRRRALGAVFQDPMSSLNPTMRVGPQVVESAGSSKEAVRLLGAVGVPEPERRMRAYPHELSGGLRQRVMLAMALGGGPKLVIADEPTTALDVTVQAQVLDLFRRMRDDIGCAIVLITHDLGVAATVADRLCVLYGGRVFETGAAKDVLGRPAHPYTAALLRSRIELRADRAAELPTIAGEPPDPRAEESGCSFAPRCPAVAERCREERPPLLPVTRHAGLAACHFEAGGIAAERLDGLPWPAAAAPRGEARVAGLSVRFAGRRGLRRRTPFDALSSVDLSVAPGESVALVGESGSGKTTLLRVLAGLQDPTQGEVDVACAPQMVFQDAGASLTPWLTVGEHLAERVRGLPTGERRARVAGALSRLGLPPEVARVLPRSLSGGQRQRVALARVIIEPPELLLCDEPISALDASLAASVLNLLGRLRRQLGFAMVFVTHDLAAARLVADRIVVMNQGRIVEEAPAEQLVREPSEPYTRALLAAVPEVPAWR